MLTNRQHSINYWSQRNPHRGFRSFLLCCKKNNDLPQLPKDIQKHLLKYVVTYIPLHLPIKGNPTIVKNKVTGESFKFLQIKPNPRQIDLVKNITLNLPENTLQCVHLSARRYGSEHYRVNAVFWIKDERIANLILSMEKQIFESVPKEVHLDPIKPTIVKSKSNGYTLFYSYHTQQVTHNWTIAEYYQYNVIDHVSLINQSLKSKYTKEIILKKGEWVNSKIQLQIFGICNKVRQRSKLLYTLFNMAIP